MLRTKYQKILVGLLGFYLLLKLLLWQPVFDAIINFCFGGIIPGTDMVVAADTVLWTLFSLLLFGVVGLLIVVRLRVYRTTRRLGMALLDSMPDKPQRTGTVHRAAAVPHALAPELTPAHTGTTSLSSEAHVAAPKAMAASSAMSPSSEKRPAVSVVLPEISRLVQHRVRLQRQAAAVWLQMAYRQASGLIRRTAEKLLAISLTMVAFAAVCLEIAVTLIVLWSKRIWRYSSLKAVQGWSWAEPRLRRLDAWLEQRTKTAVAAIRRRLERSESFQFIVAMLKSYGAASRPRLQTVWISIKTYADKVRSMF